MNKHKKKWRRRLIAGLCLFLGLILLWQLVEYFIDVDRYRPLIIKKLEVATGLPVAMGELDLSIFPTPNVRTYSLAIGEDDFSATARQFVVYINLRALLDKRIDVTKIRTSGLMLKVPQNYAELSEHLKELRKNLSSSKPGENDRRISVSRIVVDDCKLFRGAQNQHVATFDVLADDVLTDNIPVELKCRLHQWGMADAYVRVTLSRNRENRSIGLGGIVRVNNLALEGLVDTHGLPITALNMEARIDNTLSLDNVPMAFSGEVISPDSSFSAPFKANALYDNGSITLNDLTWNSPAASLNANLTWSPDSELACEITKANLMKPILDKFLGEMENDKFSILTRRQSSLQVDNLLFGVSRNDGLRVVSGNLQFNAIDVRDREGREIVEFVKGKGEVDENILTLSDISGNGFNTNGTIVVDPGNKQTTINISGEVGLDQKRMALLPIPKDIQIINGTLMITKLEGTFSSQIDATLPRDLIAEGSVKDVSVRIDSGDYSDSIDYLTCSFALQRETDETGHHIKVVGSADSEIFGSSRYSGVYSFSDATWQGMVEVNLERAADTFLKTDKWTDTIKPILAVYTPASLKLDIANKPDEIYIDVAHKGPPAADAHFTLKRDSQNVFSLDSGNLSVEVPVALLKEAIPPTVKAEGLAPLKISLKTENGTQIDGLDGKMDLTKCNVAVGTYLRKSPDIPASISFNVLKDAKGWQARHFSIECNGEDVKWIKEGKQFKTDDLDINIAPLKEIIPILEDGSGGITGEIEFAPVIAKIDLNNANFDLALPQQDDNKGANVVLNELSGHIEYDDQGWLCRDLHVQCSGSDFSVTANNHDHMLHSNLSGKKLDINTFPSVVGALLYGLGKTDEQEQTLPYQITAVFDEVLYKNTNFSDVSADITPQNKTITIRNIVAIPYSGKMTASIDVDSSVFAMNTLLDAADAQVVDEILFSDNPRGLRGAITGPLKFSVPLNHESHPINGTDCEGQLTVRDGTLGKMGVATRLLSALDASKLFKLRLPSFKDKGLTFNSCTIDFVMNDGVLFLKNLTLESPSFAMDVTGTVDFPKQKMHLLIQAYMLEGVTNLIGNVPVVGGIAERLKKLTPVSLLAVGPPDNPQIHIDVKREVGVLKDKLEQAAKMGEKAVVEGIIGGASKAMGGIIGIK